MIFDLLNRLRQDLDRFLNELLYWNARAPPPIGQRRQVRPTIACLIPPRRFEAAQDEGSWSAPWVSAL